MAQQAGVSEEDFNVKGWSGISFRKFSLSALARHVQPQLLAAHGEHGSVEITNKYYVTQSVTQRAEHTSLISKGFKQPAKRKHLVDGKLVEQLPFNANGNH